MNGLYILLKEKAFDLYKWILVLDGIYQKEIYQLVK